MKYLSNPTKFCILELKILHRAIGDLKNIYIFFILLPLLSSFRCNLLDTLFHKLKFSDIINVVVQNSKILELWMQTKIMMAVKNMHFCQLFSEVIVKTVLCQNRSFSRWYRNVTVFVNHILYKEWCHYSSHTLSKMPLSITYFIRNYIILIRNGVITF